MEPTEPSGPAATNSTSGGGSTSGRESTGSGDPASDTVSTTDRDRAAVERAKRVGHLMDDAVRVPGTDYRVGLDPILGILPVSGDAAAALGALYIVFEGYRIGVPLRTLATMVLLVGVDFLVGSIPILGTLIDAGTKVNRRNARTLESHVDARSA